MGSLPNQSFSSATGSLLICKGHLLLSSVDGRSRPGRSGRGCRRLHRRAAAKLTLTRLERPRVGAALRADGGGGGWAELLQRAAERISPLHLGHRAEDVAVFRVVVSGAAEEPVRVLVAERVRPGQQRVGRG